LGLGQSDVSQSPFCYQTAGLDVPWVLSKLKSDAQLYAPSLANLDHLQSLVQVQRQGFLDHNMLASVGGQLGV